MFNHGIEIHCRPPGSKDDAGSPIDSGSTAAAANLLAGKVS